MTPEPEVHAQEVDGFLAAIHDRYGYDLRGYAPPSIYRRVRAALRRSRLDTVAELERRSLADPDFFARVFESLTVQVSEMFRDPPFFLALRERVVPLLRTYPRLNIWVGGCATGEEAYSVAILLSEENLYDRSQIYATDLSPQALEQAKQGVYSGGSVAALASNYAAAGGRADLARHTTTGYGRLAVHDSLRRNISFFQHDLVADRVFGEMDVILCRNVLIYFGRELKHRVFRKLGDSLRPGGFLCLGPSEQLSRESRAMFVDFVADKRIYKRDLSA